MGPGASRSPSRIADLGDLRVFGALEDIDATGLTATPAFDDAAREGDLLRMPDWSAWKGATIAVGQPGALFLLAPASHRHATRLGNSLPIVGILAPRSPDPARWGTTLGILAESGLCLPIDDLPCPCAAMRNGRVAGQCTCAFVPSREID